MRVAIGSDHAGYALKVALLEQLDNGTFVDLGTHTADSCDYPEIAFRVAEAVAAGEADTGILICGTGVGMAIAANKVPGIRAAACSETYTARLTRDHNDANVICLGARVVGEGLAEEIIRVWLGTSFSGGERHQRRLDLITAREPKRGPS